MVILIWFIGLNWVVPFILSWTFALVMTYVFKDYVFEGFAHGMGCFRLVNEGKEEDEIGDKLEPWHVKLWLDWGGMALVGVMLYRDRPGKWDNTRVVRTKLHEGTHGIHIYILGFIIFGISYAGHMLWIFVTQRLRARRLRRLGINGEFPYNKHPYYDCWSERLARKRAGQLINIPPDQWSWGKDDLWPWW